MQFNDKSNYLARKGFNILLSGQIFTIGRIPDTDYLKNWLDNQIVTGYLVHPYLKATSRALLSFYLDPLKNNTVHIVQNYYDIEGLC